MAETGKHTRRLKRGSGERLVSELEFVVSDAQRRPGGRGERSQQSVIMKGEHDFHKAQTALLLLLEGTS